MQVPVRLYLRRIDVVFELAGALVEEVVVATEVIGPSDVELRLPVAGVLGELEVALDEGARYCCRYRARRASHGNCKTGTRI